MTETWLNLLGLARRAGKLAPGENQTMLAMRNHRAALVIIARDAGGAVHRKYHLWAQDEDIPLAHMGTKESLGRAIGMGPHAVLAILDEGFSGRILEEMRKSSGGIIVGRKRERQDQGVRAGQRAQTRQPAPDRPASPAQGGKYQKSYEYGGTGSRQNGSRHYGGKAAPGAKAGSEERSPSRKSQAQAGPKPPARRHVPASKPQSQSPKPGGASKRRK